MKKKIKDLTFIEMDKICKKYQIKECFETDSCPLRQFGYCLKILLRNTSGLTELIKSLDNEVEIDESNSN